MGFAKRLDGLDQRFVALDQKIDERFSALDQKIDQKVDALSQQMGVQFRWLWWG